jgi:capsular polysaccharide transport system permease protein
VPQPWQDFLWYNPVVHVIGQMRRAFYPTYAGDYVAISYPFGVGLALLMVALIFLNRYNRDILNQL